MEKILIVGHGIAGAVLGWTLRRAGVDVFIMDAGKRNSASRVSAGIINPLTGRRFALAWNYDELERVFIQTYGEMSEAFDCQLLLDRTILREVTSIRQLNDLQGKYDERFFIAPKEGWKKKFSKSHLIGIKGYQLDVQTLLDRHKAYCVEHDQWIDKDFSYWNLQRGKGGKLSYSSNTYDAIVFCDGSGIRNNHFFSQLPVQGFRGQVLRGDQNTSGVVYNDLDSTVFKMGKFLVKLPSGDCWYGAKDRPDTFDEAVSEDDNRSLIDGALDRYGIDLSQFQAQVGVRLTVEDRRPVMGEHPSFSGLYLMNGMGTKGASLAPYCAHQLMNLILNDEAVNSELDLNRFAFALH